MKQLLTFFALAFLISWIIWLPSYGHIFGLNNLPALRSQHAIGALGTLIASFHTTCIFLKKDGIKNLISKCFKTKPLVYLAIALLSPLVFMAFALIIWIQLEMAFLNVVHWLHKVYMFYAITILFVALLPQVKFI